LRDAVIDDEIVVERFIRDLRTVVEYQQMEATNSTLMPFFTTLGMYSLHYPPIYDDEYDNMYENVDDQNYVGRYLNAAHKFDRVLNKLFTGLKDNDVLDNTVILMVGDHGEAVYKRPHAVNLRASLVFPEVTRPLMSMYLPTSIIGTADDNDDNDEDTVQYAARKQEQLAHSTADLLPTLIDFMGQEPCHCVAVDDQPLPQHDDHHHRKHKKQNKVYSQSVSLSHTCYMSGRSLFRNTVRTYNDEPSPDEVSMSISRNVDATSSDSQHPCILPMSLRNEIIRRQISDESICPYVEKHFVFAAHTVDDKDNNDVKLYRNSYRFIASASYSRLRPYHTHSHSLLLADSDGTGRCHLFWDDYYPSIQLFPISLGYNFTDHVKHASTLPQAVMETGQKSNRVYIKPLVLSGPSDTWQSLTPFHQQQWLTVASCFENAQRKACPQC